MDKPNPGSSVPAIQSEAAKLKQRIFAQALAACERDDNTGICVKCGNEQSGCEPDARAYECEECGQPTVFGAEEIMLQGF